MLLLLLCEGVVNDAMEDREGRGCRSARPNGGWDCRLNMAELLLLLMLLLMLLRLFP